MKEALPFTYEIVAGSEVPDRLAAWRGEGVYLPVVLGAPSCMERLMELWEEGESFDDIRQRGLALDVDDWLRQRLAEEPEYYVAEGPATGVTPTPPLMGARDVLTGKFLPQVVIALTKVTHPWEVPAVLRPGGWNECPSPEEHLAFFKRWHERYGATVTTVADDVIEFEVSRPPTSHAEAELLAKEQFVYCADIVHQGVDTLANLTASLNGARHWYFWWD